MIESLCKTCEKRPTCDMYEPIATVAGCSYFVSQKKNVKTNADRIRAMTDEELAEFHGENACPPGKTDQITLCDPICERYPECGNCWLDWLRQEANDD